MDRLINAMKAYTGAQDAGAGQPRFGKVTSVDPTKGTVRVELQPEGVLTGWLPLLGIWIGDGWGLSAPPNIGDQVFVLPQEGDAEHGVVIGRAWSTTANVPNTPVGEIWITHKTGSYLRLLNDGTISVRGDLHVAGDVYDRRGSLSQLRGHYNQHTHNESRGGRTDQPNPQD